MKKEEINPKEEKQNIETNKRREILEKYFSGTYTSRSDRNYENTTSFKPFRDNNEDEFEKTGEIDEVGIEELKQLVAQLKELDYDNEEKEQSETPSKGKVLKKVNPNYKEHKEDIPNDDIKEITNAFINCFVLALITAAIGTGWLLFIINHI